MIANRTTHSSIPAGSRILIGAPAEPMPSALREKLANGLRDAGVIEAHLPMVHVMGRTGEPAEILAVVVEAGPHSGAVVEKIGTVLRNVLPQGSYLDVWPLRPGHSLLKTIRKTNCCVLGNPVPKTWWKLWQ